MVQNVFWCLHDTLCINIIGVNYTTLNFNFDHYRYLLTSENGTPSCPATTFWFPKVWDNYTSVLAMEISLKVDLFTVSFNFWHGQVRENPLTPLKRAPKIRKIAKFESDSLRANEDTAPKVVKFYCRLYSGGHKLAPTIQTSLNFRNFAELCLLSLKTYHFQN